ncbi:hypothetical protein AACH06_05090 [Ideonella sp. DXS29W]|uniref:Pyridine nucleotide-disulfide oxidoreductase n=1 Tax=Ideonella lacteola TaxID=2984193 RepID=A0ABU9BJP8_9BURK
MTGALDAPDGRAAVAQAALRRFWRVAQSVVWTAAVVASAWLASRLLSIEAGSDTGYWIGVAGGSAMLALFLYPLRKRLAAMRRLGATRHWFVFHMLMGALGPWLILVHCSFRIGSLNAAVALVSMLVVAGSGVIGRFLYVHVHRGLDGRRAELAELRQRLHTTHDKLAASLALAPRVRQRLFAFEETALAAASQRRGLAWVWASNRAARDTRREVRRLIDEALADAPPGLDADRRRRIRRLWREQASSHIAQTLSVVQLRTWEKLFSLWHVLHLPFVYLMVACAVVHVVAVHAY